MIPTGFDIEFNWILKIKNPKELENLSKGGKRIFIKKGKRVYPVGIPLLLCDKDLNCMGYVRIIRTIMTDKMEIEVDIEELFEGNRKEVMTHVLREMYG